MAAVPVHEAFAEPNVPSEAPPLPMSYEAFLGWLDEDKHAEWVNGEVVMHSPASRGHNRLGRFLTTIANVYIAEHDLVSWLRQEPLLTLRDIQREWKATV